MQEEAGGKFSCQCKSGWKGNRCERKNDSFYNMSAAKTELSSSTKVNFIIIIFLNYKVTIVAIPPANRKVQCKGSGKDC